MVSIHRLCQSLLLPAICSVICAGLVTFSAGCAEEEKTAETAGSGQQAPAEAERGGQPSAPQANGSTSTSGRVAESGAAAGGPGKSKEVAAKKPDPFAVPEDKNPEELMEFIKTLAQRQPESEEEQQKSLEAIVEAASLIIASDQAKEETKLEAIPVKFQVLAYLQQLDPESGEQRLQTFLEELKKDEQPAVKQMVSDLELQLQAGKLMQLSGEEFSAQADKVLLQLREGEFNENRLHMGMQIANILEFNDNPELAAKTYNTLAELARESGDENLADNAAKLEGSAKRLNLIGNEIEIEGETLDGEQFNIEDWRGKVVLVDYWATWCGPCIQELPNVKENYEKYHDKGFEIVGISLDNDAEQLEEFVKDREITWTTLFNRDEPEKQGWEHPLATQYGVMSIPTVILLDKEGKVVSLNARGEELGTLLAGMLGPVEEKPSEQDETEPAKASDADSESLPAEEAALEEKP